MFCVGIKTMRNARWATRKSAWIQQRARLSMVQVLQWWRVWWLTTTTPLVWRWSYEKMRSAQEDTGPAIRRIAARLPRSTTPPSDWLFQKFTCYTRTMQSARSVVLYIINYQSRSKRRMGRCRMNRSQHVPPAHSFPSFDSQIQTDPLRYCDLPKFVESLASQGKENLLRNHLDAHPHGAIFTTTSRTHNPHKVIGGWSSRDSASSSIVTVPSTIIIDQS